MNIINTYFVSLVLCINVFIPKSLPAISLWLYVVFMNNVVITSIYIVLSVIGFEAVDSAYK
jgi:hypothetical protein